MSVISLLVFPPEKLPSLDDIAKEALRGGEDIAFPEDVDLASHTGFLPVRVMGRDTGFEHYFEPVPHDALPPEVMAFGTHHVITRTGSGFEEGRAALVYLKVLARMTGGMYVYPEDGAAFGPQINQAYFDEQIAEYGQHIGRYA